MRTIFTEFTSTIFVATLSLFFVSAPAVVQVVNTTSDFSLSNENSGKAVVKTQAVSFNLEDPKERKTSGSIVINFATFYSGSGFNFEPCPCPERPQA